MRILFDARERTRNATGIGTYARNLGRELGGLRVPGVECVCIPGVERLEVGQGRRPLPARVGNLLRNLSWKQIYLPWRVLREKASVLVCLDPVGPLRSPVPTALLIYDLIFLTARAQSDAWTRYWRWLVPRCARRADLIFSPSRETRTRIVELLKIPAAKVRVFRSGVAQVFRPLGLSPAERASLSRRLGLPGSFLLTVGAHDPRRNLRAVLAAFAELKLRAAVPHKLVVIGPETDRAPEIRQLTRRLKLDREVLFLGYIPNESLPPFYGLADLYLYPSFEEGFGLTPLEAMACGCPVITSRVSSLPEVVGDAAWLVDPRNASELAGAIERILSDRPLREELARKGLERARRFSWRSGAEDILRACMSLAAEDGVAGSVRANRK